MKTYKVTKDEYGTIRWYNEMGQLKHLYQIDTYL